MESLQQCGMLCQPLTPEVQSVETHRRHRYFLLNEQMKWWEVQHGFQSLCWCGPHAALGGHAGESLEAFREFIILLIIMYLYSQLEENNLMIYYMSKLK